MELKAFLIVTDDIARSAQFYRDLFSLEVLDDHDGNMLLSGGLALQDRKTWEKFLGRPVSTRSNSSELYFETEDLDGFIEKLEALYPDTEYINRPMTHTWGQQVVRFYDQDGNLIEVGTPMN